MSELAFDIRLHAEQLQKDIAAINQKLDGFGKKVQTETSFMDKAFKNLGNTFAGMFAVGAVTAFTQELIQAAGESYKAEAKVAQAVKQTGMAAGFTAEELKKMAKNLMEATTFDDDAILNGVTAQLLTFTNITGDNFERAQKAVMDVATLLDGDLKGAAIQVGKALNDPTTALSALTRSGIQFTAEQKTMIESLIKQNRLFEAQSLILTEIERQYGGQAEALAKTPIGKIEQTKVAWDNVKESMGKVILESGLLASALDSIAKHGEAMSSDQLSFWEKWNPFASTESKYQKAIERQKEFEANQKNLEELNKANTNEGESTGPKEVVKAETNEQAIARLKKLRSEAEQTIKDLRNGDAASNMTFIDTKTQEIADINKQLETLTGVSQKSNEEWKKQREERAKALKDLSAKEVDIIAQAEAAKIALMQDGTEKQIAEAQLSYKSEMENIRRQKEEMTELLSKSGLKVGSSEYNEKKQSIDTLSTTSETLAAQKLASDKVRIEKEAADKIREIRDGISESFMSEQQKELAAVKKKYDAIEEEILKNSKSAGVIKTDNDLVNVTKARNQEIENINQDYAIRGLQFEEEIEVQRSELLRKGFDGEYKMQMARINIQRESAKKQLDILKKNPFLQGNDKEIERLMNLINLLNMDEQTAKLDKIKNTVSQVGSGFGEIVGQLEKMNVLGAGSQQAFAGIFSMFDNFTKGGTAGYIGMAVQLMTTFLQAIQKTDYTSQVKQLERMESLMSTMEKLLTNLNGLEYNIISDIYVNQLEKTVTDAQKKFKPITLRVGVKWETFDLSKMSTSEIVQFLTKFQPGGEYYNIFKGNDAVMKWVDEQIASVNALLDAEAKLKEARDQLTEKATGTLSDGIADSIIEGFRQGYSSAEDFAKNFEELMKDAVVIALKNQIITGTGPGSLTDWYQQFFDFAKDGLTQEEIDILKASWGSMVEVQRKLYDNANAVIGLGNDTEAMAGTNGLSGAIKGITEETASMIAGQFYAMREFQERTYRTGLQQMDGINMSVAYLAEIAANTRHNVKLNSIDDRLAQMNKTLTDRL